MIGGTRSLMLAAAAALTLHVNEVSAQQLTFFCLDDGTRVGAARFEVSGGNFLLYVPGATAPLVYPAGRVKGVNVDQCRGAPSPAALSRFGIHGSNTIGERLMPMLIEAYGTSKLGARPTVIPRAPEEQDIVLRDATTERAVVELHAHGSGTSATGLLAGKAVIGMSSRRIKDDERQSILTQLGTDPRQPGKEHVLALDGLAIIVNSANPVNQLSLEQIARIFSGQITDWGQVGGRAGPILVLRRDDKSGTFDTFKDLVLNPFNLRVAPSSTKFESSENLSATVAEKENAIGFIGLPYINKNRALSIASACGLASSPSPFTIKNEEYPLARRLYLYSLGQPREAIASALLQYALSDEAQSTITAAGFIDQAVELQDANGQTAWRRAVISDPQSPLGRGKTVSESAVRTFAEQVSRGERSSIAFRFESNKAVLDTRALQDVARLARYLRSPAGRGKRPRLAGFADSKGGWEHNVDLATRRAASVAEALQREGVKIPSRDLLSYSYLAPVACNDSDPGMAKNRRVEVWFTR